MSTVTISPPIVNTAPAAHSRGALIGTYGLRQAADGSIALIVAGPARWSAAELAWIPTLLDVPADRTTAVAIANRAIAQGRLYYAAKDEANRTAEMDWREIPALVEVTSC